MTPRISVVIPTNRPGGLEHAKASLPRQTFLDFEVLVGSPYDPGFGRWVRDDFTGGFWSLNRVYNRLFQEAKAELVVTLQDFIWVPPRGVERFWTAHESTGGLVTGVGHQYNKVRMDGTCVTPCWTDPRTELRNFVPTGRDGRKMTLTEVLPHVHEWNWACLPKSAVLEVGGMDEELDFIGFGCDNSSAVERIYEMRRRFYVDLENEVFCQLHGRVPDWNARHVMHGKYADRRAELIAGDNWPVLGPTAKSPSRLRPEAP